MRRISTAALVLVGALVVNGVAFAAPGTTCTYNDGTSTMIVSLASNAVATIARSGDVLTVDGVACGGATVTNTDTIDVDLPAASVAETVVVDLAGGALAPGATDEGDGSSEIEIEIAGIDESDDTLRLLGGSGSDAITTEALLANLNADEGADDHDVTVADPGIAMELDGGGGDDVLVAGGFVPNLLLVRSITGGPGDDRLSGELASSTIDGGAGRDTADYSWADFDLDLIWDTDGGFVFGAGEDNLRDVEVTILTSHQDTVAYEEGGTGETRLGAGVDFAIMLGPTAANDPDERVIRGGAGTFDWIVAGSPVTLDVSEETITGPWAARHRGFEYLETGNGDDRFLVTDRGAIPGLVGRGGRDVLDLHAATQGISATLGQDPFGPRRWILLYEIERIVGSEHADELLGPDAGSTQVRFRGRGGADFLRGGAGDDVLRGGDGPDEAHGGGGNDLVIGGPGIDVCSGGGGADEVHCEG